ncbi:MAG: hypothetical protein AB7F86_05665 [Bdellovibrionales bacterium]
MFNLLVTIFNIMMFYLTVTLIRTQDVASHAAEKRDLTRNSTYFRDRIIESIENPVSWGKAIGLNGTGCNASLQCLKNGTDCFTALAASGTVAPQVLDCIPDVLDSDTIYWDARQATAGFDHAGQPCSAFDSANPDPSCVFRPIVKWQPLCASSPCVNPLGEFTVEVQISAPRARNLNSARRQIKLIR